ncbi:hypothetical protein ABGB18_00255 [Nonomuraea sp. B12E4]|uniref:hypothetical protein n=1 Tax=Nonomuraea sp. B12E4 TaxID=3153564 RepID=UPI00325EADBC
MSTGARPAISALHAVKLGLARGWIELRHSLVNAQEIGFSMVSGGALGLGMRSAFLPDSAAALEIGGFWRPVEMLLVLGAWIVASLLLAPPILRRMARRESGSLMRLRRDRAMQRIG